MNKIKRLYYNNDNYISYKQVVGKRASLLFLGGFYSNMNGRKATRLYDYCREHDLSLIIFDYLGHGCSSGQFMNYNISDWHENCLTIIDNLVTTPQIIIGSSMGGWLMLLTALSRPEKICGLIGIAPAPDFTENLIFNKLTDTQKNQLFEYKKIAFISEDKSCSYPITKNLIDDGRKNLLLIKKEINITCQVELIHGMNDSDVPYHTSVILAEKLKSQNVNVQLLKSAKHNMSDEKSLKTIFNTIEEMISNITLSLCM